MSKAIKGQRWKTILTVGLAGSILLGGCASTEEAQQNASTGVSSEVTATQEAQAHPFPSNGLKDDGYGVYLQSTMADDDPALKLAEDSVRQRASDDAGDVWATFTEEQVSEAEAVALKFVSEEGLDSTLRGPGNAKTPQMWDAWIADNKDKFVADMRFEPAKTDQNKAWERLVTPQRLILDGLPNGTAGASYNWKQSTPFTYKYGEDVMRVTNRTFTPGEIKMPGKAGDADFGVISFEGSVSYALAIEHNGTDAVEADEATYSIDVVLDEAGEWKIHSVYMHGSQD